MVCSRYSAAWTSAEVTPFAKTGGLADVAAALPKELRRLGQDVRVVMPRYRQINPDIHNLRPVVQNLEVTAGSQTIPCTIREGRLGEWPGYCTECPRTYYSDGCDGLRHLTSSNTPRSAALMSARTRPSIAPRPPPHEPTPAPSN